MRIGDSPSPSASPEEGHRGGILAGQGGNSPSDLAGAAAGSRCLSLWGSHAVLSTLAEAEFPGWTREVGGRWEGGEREVSVGCDRH